jgi:hypothetical protein
MITIEREFTNGVLSREVEFQVTSTRETAVGAIVKAEYPDRYLLSVAYPAMKADGKMAKDGHRDFASPEVVEKAAWRFMLNGANLGMWHKDGFDHCAEVVESYIYRNPEPWVIQATDGSTQTICKGDWLLGTILQEPTWALYQAGIIGGVSPQGAAARAQVSPERLAELRSAR